MKKISLILVLIFVAGTAFAKTNIYEKELSYSLETASGSEINCVQVAFDAEERLGREYSYEEFEAVVDACEENKKNAELSDQP